MSLTFPSFRPGAQLTQSLQEAAAVVEPRQRRVRARRGEGDRLREEILAAVEQLLVQTGDGEAVSIRAVSELVGVTAPSIYRHFADRDAMVRAACTRAWERFDYYLIEAAASEADHFLSIQAAALAYLRFATTHPAEYKVLFMMPTGQTDEQATNAFDMEKSEYTSLIHIAKSLENAIEAKVILAVAEPMAMAITLWASLHGIAALRIAKPDVPWPSVEDQLDVLFAMFATGMCAQPPTDR